MIRFSTQTNSIIFRVSDGSFRNMEYNVRYLCNHRETNLNIKNFELGDRRVKILFFGVEAMIVRTHEVNYHSIMVDLPVNTWAQQKFKTAPNKIITLIFGLHTDGYNSNDERYIDYDTIPTYVKHKEVLDYTKESFDYIRDYLYMETL